MIRNKGGVEMAELRVDARELKGIASAAETKRKAQEAMDRKRAKEEKEARKQRVEEDAEAIVNEIPVALKAAAKHPKRTRQGLEVVARIDIVNQELYDSGFDHSGLLEPHDRLVLKAVRKKLRSINISGVELNITYGTERHELWSGDSCNCAHGPCRYYYIEAKTVIKK